MSMRDGILSISNAYNPDFLELLSYYNIQFGDLIPSWGKGNKAFSYYACQGFTDQIGLYRFQRLAKGGLNEGLTFLECVDSTETLHLPFKHYIYNPWKIPEYVEDNYEECFRKIIETYTRNNEYITLLWSGGVDSSAILSGFIKYGKKENFSIGYTQASINEYPLFFEYLQNNKFDLICLDNDNINISDLPGLVVHGVGGGVICDTAPLYAAKEIYSNPWHNAIVKNEWGDDYHSLFEFTEKFMKLYGKDKPTIADLCLFANMGTKANNSVMHLHYDKNLKFNKISAFYDNYLIRQWNYFHAEKYMIGSHLSSGYKIPAKKIIFDVLKDDDYFVSKKKGASQDLWRRKCKVGNSNDRSLHTPHGYFFIDYTGEFISAESKEEYVDKYNGRFDHYFNPPLL